MIKRPNFNFLTSLIVLVTVSAVPITGMAQFTSGNFTFTPVALTGDTPTGQGGAITGVFGDAPTNFVDERFTAAGIVGRAFLDNTSTDEDVITFFVPSGSSTAQVIVQEAVTPAPGASGGTFDFTGDPIANDSGDFAFASSGIIGSASGTGSDTGFFFFDSATSTISEITREGNAVQGLPGFTFGAAGGSDDPAITNNGLVAFFQETIEDATGNSSESIFVFDSNSGALTPVIQGGAVPGLPGATFGAAVDDNSISINEAGNLAFISEIDNNGAQQEVVTVFNGSTGTLEVLAQETAPAPPGPGNPSATFDTSGTIFNANEVAFSESNQLVFQGDLVGGGEGLFFDTDTTVAGGLQNFLSEQDTITLAGIGTATVDSLLGDQSFQLNSAGQFVFSLSLAPDAALGITASTDDLLVIGDINNPGSFTVLAREGDATGFSDVNGNPNFFDSFFDNEPNINEAGQVLFAATGLDTTSGGGGDLNADAGIFFFDPVDGLQLVAQEGNFLAPGDPAFGFRFDQFAGTEQLALLDDGSFVIEFATETDAAVDVAGGLFLVQFTPPAVPEPSSAMLIALVGMGGLMRRRRK